MMARKDSMPDISEKILVIKLGALGDFIQALGPMAAIRRNHPKAQITLLTTQPYKSFAQECGYFDVIWLDKKPDLTDFSGWMNLRKRLNNEKFNRVYDLQNNDRTSLYFRLFKKKNKPQWVGIAKGASHRNTSKTRSAGHAFDGHRETLALTGITDTRIDTLDWMKENISSFALRKPYILLVPGSAPANLQKRWPAAHYARLSQILVQLGYQPVIIGAETEKEIADQIMDSSPQSLNLIGQTSLHHIAALAREAATAIGNDTGPMHLIAATGCPCLALFSGFSNPVKHAPMGANVKILQEKNLPDLKPETVLESFRPRQEPPKQSVSVH